MGHVLEPAATGRAKCRGCGQALAKGELRFGERLPNPFGEGEVTHWFHPRCAAYKRADAMLAFLGEGAVVDDELQRIAEAMQAAPRLARIDGAERAPSGQARCRHCKEPIEKGAWRIRLVFHEEGTFSPGGSIHLACRKPYFEHDRIDEQLLHFSAALPPEERTALLEALSKSSGTMA